MKHSILAKRYAKAFYANLSGKKATELEEASHICATLGQNVVFLDMIKNPQITTIQKQNTLNKIFSKHIKSESIKSFITYLVQKKRTDILSSLAQELQELKELEDNTAEARIITALAMNEKEKKQLVLYLEKQVSKTINPTFDVDDEILGGFKAYVGDLIVDGSLENTLNKMKEKIKA